MFFWFGEAIDVIGEFVDFRRAISSKCGSKIFGIK